MAREVVFVTGHNPTRGKGGGSCYVRAHMRAAQWAGYAPHVFCLDAENGVSEEDFGVVHRVVPPPLLRRALAASAAGRPRRFLAHWLGGFVLSPYAVAAHSGRLAASIERFLADRAGPHLIHGFYTWGCIGLDVRERMQRRGVETAVVSSVYTTARHEARAKARGASAGRWLHRAVFRAERLWIERAVARHERRAYRESRLVLLNYESVRRLFLAEHGAGAETRMTPYSAEAAFFAERAPEPQTAPPAREADAPLIVSVSRHDPRKGIDVLIRALAALKSDGVRFRACLVSGGPLLDQHRRLAERLGLAGTVTFTGWVADAQPFLAGADIFVLPSLQEGGGSLALLEAMQAGAAVVASNVDGIPEDVVDGESALLVEPGDADALRGALARVLSDAALRQALRRRARAAHAERFSAGAFAAAMASVYAELGFGA
jgi:glycosyltransferase involved in cell wall biosynthesis